MTSLVTLFSAFFTISVGSLYQSHGVPFSDAVNLHTTNTFRTNFTSISPDFKGDIQFSYEDGEARPSLYNPQNVGTLNFTDNVGFVSSLILENNLSFTPLVYENLVFPEFSLELNETMSALQSYENSSSLIHVTVPALRPRLSCRLYPVADITATFFYNETIQENRLKWKSDGIAVNVTEEGCQQGAGQFSPHEDFPFNNVRTFTTDLPGKGLFAAAFDNRTASTSRCSYFLYIWGRYTSSGNSSISATALGCNDTLEAVDVAMTLVGPQLQLDPTQPPRPIESTAIPLSTKIEIENESFVTGDILSLVLYNKLASLPPYSNETVFDPFFEQLVTSRYAIPVSAIEDPSQNETVIDAITFQHGVIAAQYYSKKFRVNVDRPLNDRNESARAMFPSISSAPPTGDNGVYHGTISNPNGRRRLIQDPTSTRVIQGLLLTTLVLSLLGWALGPWKAMLPRSTTSVASVLALLAGGDVLEHMYKDGDAQWDTIEDAKLVFRDGCKFWMGWGPPGISEEKTEKRFGIWIMKETNE